MPTMYQKILVATDGSECSEAAVAEAAKLAQTIGGALTVLAVVDTSALLGDGAIDAEAILNELTERANRHVRKGEAIALEQRVSAHVQVVEGSPVEQIVRASAAYDVVVMGSHGRGFLKRLILGSVTQAVLHRIAKPLLVVHCPAHPTT